MIRTSPASCRRARPGFTLVELMVSAAIVVIIMAILATAFQTGIDTMRQMRSAGDMMDQLRSAGEVIKRDLRAPHFLPQDGKPNLGLRVSEQEIDRFGTTGWDATQAPRGGFFRLLSPQATYEGQGAEGLQSTRATEHLLHFTAVLPGGADQNLFTAVVPAANGTQLASRAAEIAYFLAGSNPQTFTNGTPGPGRPNSLPLLRLIRRQRLVAMTDADRKVLQSSGETPRGEVISWPTASASPNRMADVASTPANRLTLPTSLPDAAGTATLNTSARLGDDILLSSVISFEVRAHWVPASGTKGPRTFAIGAESTTGTPEYPFDTLAPQIPTGEFDTRANPPSAIRVKAVQIKLRVWDSKMKTARQMTIVQDL